MSHYILDTCSIMHFLAIGEQNALIKVAEHNSYRLAVCTQVQKEITKVADKPKFNRTGASGNWNKISGSRVEVMPDDITKDGDLAGAMEDLHDADDYGGELSARLDDNNDLGEFVSVAHALRLARLGHIVTVIVDDHYGRELMEIAAELLDDSNPLGGQIGMSSTRKVFEAAEQLDPNCIKAKSAHAAFALVKQRTGDTVPTWP